MLFNSYVFLFLFLPPVLLGWWGLRRPTLRLLFLALASYVFYGWWDYRFVPLMLLASSADLVAGWLVARSGSPAWRRVVVTLLLVFNLGLLAFFKYGRFLAANLNALGELLGRPWHVPLLDIVLPVGISFYTFNSISYTIDVYRREIRPTRSVISFSAFVAMFPHLVAGPIIRYAAMGEQFERLPERPRSGQLVAGVWLFVLGMCKKVLLADSIAMNFVTPLFASPGSLRMVASWTATLAYSMQIYFDFSGYSDMAVGLALLLGLRFPQNFDSPYKATNIAEFWRRWHISLSFWLRDYLFIPLGGSRGGALKTLRNLTITMFLGGLWHGASWTFVLWGLYHGVLLVGHWGLRSLGLVPRSRFMSTAATFLAVMGGWVLFRSASLTDALALLRGMAGARGLESAGAVGTLLWGSPSLVLGGAVAVAFLAPNTWHAHFFRTRWAGFGLGAALFWCVLHFAQPSPFLYFQF